MPTTPTRRWLLKQRLEESGSDRGRIGRAKSSPLALRFLAHSLTDPWPAWLTSNAACSRTSRRIRQDLGLRNVRYGRNFGCAQDQATCFRGNAQRSVARVVHFATDEPRDHTKRTAQRERR